MNVGGESHEAALLLQYGTFFPPQDLRLVQETKVGGEEVLAGFQA